MVEHKTRRMNLRLILTSWFLLSDLMTISTSARLIKYDGNDGFDDKISINLNTRKLKSSSEVLEISTTFKPPSCLLKTQVNDQLAVTYVGTFPNTGKRFDASEDPNNPFVFKVGVGQVIKGWDQGMLNMCEGEKRTLNIPSSLAYGHEGAGDDIPPDSPLRFQVELIKILSRKYEPTSSLKKLDIQTIEKPHSCIMKSKNGDQLAMIYVGTLKSSGLQFDAIRDPKQPFVFKLGARQVIQGWDEGLKDMCIGEKRRLFIPASMAYGAHGVKSSDPPIPPNADLVFDTELLNIERNGSKAIKKEDDQKDEDRSWISIWILSLIQASINLFETILIFL